MLLSWLILIPFFGGLLCWQCERFNVCAPRWIAIIAMGLTLTLSLLLFQQGRHILAIQQGLSQWPVEYLLPWIPSFGISIHLALDGLSFLMVLLTGLLGVLAILCSWHEIQRYPGIFHLNLLWILGSVIGAFLAIDMFLFFFFWEMILVPMYFLIALWGHKVSESKIRIAAATKFFIYTQAGSLVMMAAIISLVLINYNNTNIWTFNYTDLLHVRISEQMEYLLMLGFFLAFAIKMPLVPLHGWLPDANSQAPTAGSVDLSGILSKTAAYGMLRFSLPLFPHASHQFAPIAMLIGILSIFYGAWMAFSQADIKRFISYTSISHMGFMLIGVYSGRQIAYQGVVVQMIAHSLSAAGMFIISGQIYERLKTRDTRKMGGLWGRLSFIPASSLFFSAAMLGMPGTGNFIGEITILLGSFPVAPIITIVSTFSLVFSSVYSLIMMQRVYYGPAKSTEPLLSTTLRERLIILILVLLLVLLGFFPQLIIDTSAVAMNNIQH